MLNTNEEQIDINMLPFHLFFYFIIIFFWSFPTQLAFDLKPMMICAEV